MLFRAFCSSFDITFTAPDWDSAPIIFAATYPEFTEHVYYLENLN